MHRFRIGSDGGGATVFSDRAACFSVLEAGFAVLGGDSHQHSFRHLREGFFQLGQVAARFMDMGDQGVVCIQCCPGGANQLCIGRNR